MRKEKEQRERNNQGTNSKMHFPIEDIFKHIVLI